MRISLARGLSIAGHPLVLAPLAALSAALSHAAPVKLIRVLLIAVLAGSIAVLAFSHWNVRSGRWTHIDASNPPERRALNGFLVGLLLLGSAIAWRADPTHQLSLGLLIAASAVMTALALSPLLKISLHTCFAALAAGFLWPSPVALAVGAAVVLALAWSRLTLRRHTPTEVFSGALIGALSAGAFHALVP
jgi:membrane-associated phospholipid phosphatase